MRSGQTIQPPPERGSGNRLPIDEGQMLDDVPKQLDEPAQEKGYPATPIGNKHLAMVVLKGDTYRRPKPICCPEVGDFAVILVLHGKLRLPAAHININC